MIETKGLNRRDRAWIGLDVETGHALSLRFDRKETRHALSLHFLKILLAGVANRAFVIFGQVFKPGSGRNTH